jgi:anti-sigma regulatory factor (Ser/Thr protein kinase)
MSNINIRRAIENIRSTTTVFTPIVETVVNAIEAIEATGVEVGVVSIAVRRSPQLEVDAAESKIIDVLVTDNGIGFTNANRDSFDTLYSEYKISQGGKGFGRFTCLKYFDDLRVDSVFFDGQYRRRSFSMGKGQVIIVDETLTDAEGPATGTTVTLAGEKSGSLPRKLSTLSRGLVEMLLPYFTTEGYRCPRIELHDLV